MKATLTYVSPCYADSVPAFQALLGNVQEAPEHWNGPPQTVNCMTLCYTRLKTPGWPLSPIASSKVLGPPQLYTEILPESGNLTERKRFGTRTHSTKHSILLLQYTGCSPVLHRITS